MPEPNQPVPDDVIALLRAEGDQQQAAAGELARILIAFRKPLVDGGMADTAADTLTLSYWSLLVAKGLSNG